MVRAVTGVLGELLVTAGVLVLGFVAWQVWGTGVATAHSQDALRGQLREQFSHGGAAPRGGRSGPGAPAGSSVRPGPPVAPPPEGHALLRLRIARIGVDWVVVEGVALHDLAEGPGHYPESVMPGQVGNFAVAGHRTTHGAPFFRIGELHAGDTVTAQVVGSTYTYRVTSREVVSPTDVGVVAPVPDRPGVAPTQRLLTLTSCNPQYSARQRIVVHAVLVSTEGS